MLLEWAEVDFEVKVTQTDETYPAGTKTEDVPIVIARNKALAIEHSTDEIVIAADTVVVLEDEIIGKPVDPEDAKNILRKLSGKTHRVITGVVIINGGKEISFSDITEVSFYQLTDEQIDYYISNYAPFDKAGAYAIQEWIGVTGIEKINGDFYNVMGLPVSRVVKTLHELR